MALGSTAAGVSSVAVGDSAQALGASSVAVGDNAQALGDGSIAIGKGAVASGSIAIGVGAQAALGGTAVGDGAVATGANSTAIGLGANATLANSAAFGTRRDGHARRPAGVRYRHQHLHHARRYLGRQQGGPGGAHAYRHDQPDGRFSRPTRRRSWGSQRPDATSPILQGQINSLGRRDQELADGIAISLALAQPIFQPGQTFAMRVGWGNFDGSNAVGVTAAGVVGRGYWGPTRLVVLDAGIGTGNGRGSRRRPRRRHLRVVRRAEAARPQYSAPVLKQSEDGRLRLKLALYRTLI